MHKSLCENIKRKGGETMKKVKLFLVAALVFGVILSSYGVSGTYAKYVSELSATADQARVARWNFGIKDGSLEEGDFSNTVKLNLFASSYKCKTSDNGNCVQALNCIYFKIWTRCC